MALVTATFRQHPNPDTVEVDIRSWEFNVSYWELYQHTTLWTAQGTSCGLYEDAVHGPVVTAGSIGYLESTDVDAWNYAQSHWHSPASQASWYYEVRATMNDNTTQSLTTTSSPKQS